MGDYYVGSFMGGLGRGWDQGKKMADDVRERRMRKDIEQASQERAEVDAGMEDEALWRSDNSAQQARMLEEQTGGMGLHRAGGKDYANLADATQAADKFNSLEGRYGRLAGVYARHGQAEKAMAFEKAIQDIAHQKQVADEATKRTALAEKQFGLEQARHDLTMGEHSRKENLREAYNAMQGVVDPKDRDVGVRAVYGALGDVGAAEQYDAQLLQRDAATATLARQRADDDRKTTIDAYNALRTGNVAKANVEFNKLGTAKLVITTGKTDKKTGQPIYQVFDPKTKTLEISGTPDQLITQALPYAEAQQIIYNQRMLELKERELKLDHQAKMAAVAAKGGTGAEKLTALTGYANSLNTEIANLDRAIGNDPESPAVAGLRLQRDKAWRALQAVRSQIETGRLGLPGEAASEGLPSAARAKIIDALGKDGWTKANVDKASARTGVDITKWPEYAAAYKTQSTPTPKGAGLTTRPTYSSVTPPAALEELFRRYAKEGLTSSNLDAWVKANPQKYNAVVTRHLQD